MEAEKKIVSQKWQLYAGGPDGSKRWFLYTTGIDGKRIRDYAALGRIKDLEARRLEAMRLIAQRNGTAYGKTPGQELSPIAQEWLQLVRSPNNRSNNNNRCIARKWEEFMTAHVVWYGTLTPVVAAAWVAKKSDPYIVGAKALVKLAIRKGIIQSDPFTGLRAKHVHTPATLIPAHKVEAVLAAIKKECPSLWMVCVMQYYTFIRPQELLRLELTDILLEEDCIVVPGSKSKNRRTARVVIPSPLKPLLEDYIEAYCEGKTWFFQTYKGTPLSNPSYLRIKHQRILSTLNLPKGVNLYSWKHTGAVAAARAGVPLKQLQMQLRHASLDQVNEYLRQMGVEDMDAVRKGW